MEPAHKFTARSFYVNGQDRETLVGLQTLKQIAGFKICVSVMAILDLASFTKQGIGFVKEENRPGRLGSVEEQVQILLGLPDVFTNDSIQVNAIQVSLQTHRQGLGRAGFSRDAGASEKDDGAATLPSTGIVSVTDDVLEADFLRFRQRQIFKADSWFNLVRQIGEWLWRLTASAQSK